MDEKVSIIVPIYNVEEYLERCLDSLAVQSYSNIEILLVDDCSTDGSAGIAQRYAQKNPRIFQFIEREKNGGLSAARNTGMEEARGQWLAFVDSDDWVTEDYISAMYRKAKDDNADIVICSLYYYYSENNYKEMCPFGDLTTQSSHKEKVALIRPYACGKLFRKSLFENFKIKFPEDIQRSEDIAAIIPVCCMTERISLLHRPLYYYYQRATSLSNQNQKGMDLSFYPRTVERMFALSPSGFEKELEFRAISDLMYGMIMLMIRAQYNKEEIVFQIHEFKRYYPDWRNNPYIVKLPKAKQIFIWQVGKENYRILKIMIFLWDRIK